MELSIQKLQPTSTYTTSVIRTLPATDYQSDYFALLPVLRVHGL
jgi:hypothetical protein